MSKRFPICKLRLWRGGNWISYDTKTNDVFLNVHIDQLLITSDSNNTIYETFNMNSKVKGIYKNDVFLLMVSENSQEVRKIKFQIKTNTISVIRHLSQHFPVSKYLSMKHINKNMKFRNINEHFQAALNDIENNNENLKLPLPEAYKNFVKLCLLDPAFPMIIRETQNILSNEIVPESKVQQNVPTV